MNSKRWLLGFLATAVVLGAAVLGFNWLVDPFGVFSHKALEWPSYEMTMNPRTAKITYLKEHHEEYDSYQFHGTVPLKEMVNWTPSFLPEGYIESKRTDLGTLVEITYDCKDLDMWITFSYLRLAEGSGFDLDNEHHVVTEISVQDMDGYLYTASEDKLNAVVWFNETLGYGSLLSSRLPPDTLLKVAESVNMNTKS